MTGPDGPPTPGGDTAVAALVTLASLPGIGPATLWRCHRECGPEAALDALVRGRPELVPALRELRTARSSRRGRAGGSGDGTDLLERTVRAAREADPSAVLAANRAEGEVLVHGTGAYPARLAADPWAPAVVFTRGDRAVLDGCTVAVVGTRNATRPGRDLAAGLGRDLAEAGVNVVSGLALGIDGAAHRGALAGVGGGSVVGVVASGLDIAYPSRHADLQARVASSGLLLTETPAGRRPQAWRFPARNRILAALADVVVVVESRSDGGSLHTVREALSRGVPVMAVPGHPFSPSAAGTNDLLADGAAPVRDVEDILVTLGLDAGARTVARSAPSGPQDLQQQEIMAAIGEAPASLAEIVIRSARPLEHVAAVLARLEVDGWVARDGGWFERSTPDAAPAPPAPGESTGSQESQKAPGSPGSPGSSRPPRSVPSAPRTGSGSR